MVYLMRSISFLNCLMPQDKGGESLEDNEKAGMIFSVFPLGAAACD